MPIRIKPEPGESLRSVLVEMLISEGFSFVWVHLLVVFTSFASIAKGCC
jgi:hypothetical protein